MNTPGKAIKLRTALILGNFYHQNVKIIQAINDGYDTFVDAIVGIKKDMVLTKNGRSIFRDSIVNIYQI